MCVSKIFEKGSSNDIGRQFEIWFLFPFLKIGIISADFSLSGKMPAAVKYLC